MSEMPDVAAMRGYLATLQKLVAAAQAEGRSGSALVEPVMPALADGYGQLEFFGFWQDATSSRQTPS